MFFQKVKSVYNDKVKVFLIIIVSIFLILLFLEIIARVGFSFYTDLKVSGKDKWYISSPELVWEPRPNHEQYGKYARSWDDQGYLQIDSEQKNDGNKKIVFIGDSNTYGYRVKKEDTFVEVLDTMLPDVSAINLGLPGYTSYQGYQTLFKKGLELNPDYLVVSFNYNDRRYVLDVNAVDSSITFNNIYKKQEWNQFVENLQLEKIYIYKSMKSIIRMLGLIEDHNKNLKRYSISTMHPRVSPINYRKNLNAIAELAKGRNIRLIFLLLKDNPIQTEDLNNGVKLLESEQYDQAVESLRDAVDKNNAFSTLARKYLSRAYKEMGLVDESKKVLMIKPYNSLHGGFPVYLDREYNVIMKEVARKYNAKLIDAGSVLDEKPSYYMDMCHPYSNGHRKIAHLLYEYFKDQ